MKHYLLLLFFLLVSMHLSGQNQDTWHVIWNEDSTLFGFKDQYDAVKIEPKLERGLFGEVNKFNNVIGLWRKKSDKKYESYYLNKVQKAFGVDSVYVFDFSVDCESEGFVRFVGEDEKIGMFNQNGTIVIPASYDALTRVRNGMTLGLKDAKKEYWAPDHEHSDECNHHSWVGGTRVLLNSKNEVLAENIEVENPFDFHSLQVESNPSTDKNRVSFKGLNGRYYSFIDYQEEFKSWLSETFLPNIRDDNFESVLFEQIIFETAKLKGKMSIKDVFSKHNKSFKRLLFAPFNYGYDYSFDIEDLNYFIYDDSKYEKFLNNCGEPDLWLYPEMVFRAENKADKTRYFLHFIRVGNDDYKLTYCYQD